MISKGWKNIYTDYSKSKIGLGATATPGNHTESTSLPKFSSGLTVETDAIHLSLIKISARKINNFSVLPDSRNCLQTLHKQITTNPNVRKLKHTIANP